MGGGIVEIELQEIRQFISVVPPFDLLSENELKQIVQRLGIRYLRRGKFLPPDSKSPPSLYFIRQGTVSLYSTDNELIGMLAEGELCTAFCDTDVNEMIHATATEDTLVYGIPCVELFDIISNKPQVKEFLLHEPTRRLKQASTDTKKKLAQNATLMNTPLSALVTGKVVDIDLDSSIQDASVRMTESGVSSLLITEVGKLTGIITDRDIRSRCLAKGLSPATPVKQIMTKDPLKMSSDAMAFDALMMMTQKNIHHLPVIDGQQVRGIITATDLIRQEGKNAVYLTRSIHRAESVDALVEISRMIPDLQWQLFISGGSAEHVGRAITAVSSALTGRLIEMAEKKFGPSPVPFAWVAAGSQARREQSSHSDQDNGLIISDRMRPDDEEWFRLLAEFVCDGLNACGFVYCPGDAMAKNPQWRQTENVWTSYFIKWITTPEPMALMLSSIFFDIRVIYGDKSLLQNIQQKIVGITKNNQLFLAHMTANALQHRTPLGFFRDFVLVDEGEHKDTLDLKHKGIVPIIDLARIYALAEGIDKVNTVERLKAAAGSPSLSHDGADNLLDAYEFINRLRMEHQVEQIRNGENADNYLSPKQLSRLERSHLKDVFKVVQTMQESLAQRYHTGL
jgi:CBS domain-containing protein